MAKELTCDAGWAKEGSPEVLTAARRRNIILSADPAAYGAEQDKDDK